MDLVEPTQGRVVAFVGAKGGCGTTTLAANLAAAIPADARVGLADLDFYKGDVGGALDLWPARTMHDLMVDPSRLSVDVIRGVAERHPAGFWLLAQPQDLARSLQVGVAEMAALVTALRSTWDLTLCDCGSRMDEVAASVALRADLTVLVATPDVSALRDAGRVLDLLRGLEIDPTRLRLVVNRAGGHGVALADAASLLGIPVCATVARDDATFTRADAVGRLVRDIAPRSHAARDLAALWGALDGRPSPPARRSLPALLQRFFA